MCTRNDLVSVILPVYNAEAYLSTSIKSILEQTYRDFELIIVNDGSTDGSLDVIQQFAKQDSRVTMISRKNRGIASSLNDGIAVARGTYIARMDADDISLPERLEIQVEFMSTHTNVSVVASHVEVIGEVTSEQRQIIEDNFDVSPSYLENIENWIDHCCIPHPTVMMHREFLRQLNGYNEKFVTAEDYDLWLRGLSNGHRIATVTERLLKHRVHSRSKTAGESSIIHTYNAWAKLGYISLLSRQKANVLIWGAGAGGQMVKILIDLYFADYFNVIAFVDTYKKGYFLDTPIYGPEDVGEVEHKFVLIATAPGREYATNQLDAIGYQHARDFFWML